VHRHETPTKNPSEPDYISTNGHKQNSILNSLCAEHRGAPQETEPSDVYELGTCAVEKWRSLPHCNEDAADG